ncbi:autotransporter assembly complex protein TamA [Thalassorhabdomicrobium marinisediminis]|uniref:autotransporter assembly complex protein TamA n=1 Tax=Thalassorhabdomicrobium marinisediminis TaxID=2170577 RepID=UPI002491ECDE|nr:BamA/TamA family outer membrane protein [Thalassorhabdomicrobium marinisediminis]
MRKSITAAALGLMVFPLCAAAQDVRLITPDGTEGDLRSALRAASLTLSLEEDGAEAPQDYVAAARADYRRLLTGLYAEGYYGGTISILVDGIEASALDPLAAPPSVQTVQLRVDPGPRFTFGRAEIGPLAPGTELPEGFAPGRTARSAAISDAASAAVNGWRNDGRPLAEPGERSITARHSDQKLDATVIIEPGPVLSFGNVTVEGNEAVRSERIRAIAGIDHGIYDPEVIARAEANLRRTQTFASATVIEGETPEGETLPLTIAVVEQPPRRIGFGAEFSSIKGLTLSSFWLHRNLFGGAERFRIEGKVGGLAGGTGGLDYRIAANFLRPATFRQDTDFYVNGMIEQLDEPSFFEREARIEAGIIRRLGDDVELEYGLGLSVGEAEDGNGKRSYQLVYAPIKGTLDRRNDELDATDGYYASLEIRPFLGRDVAGARAVGDGRLYRSFGENDRVTLAARGQFGAVMGAAADDVPASYLFYSGGGGTVRGQPYQSLGVDLGGGNRIGGNTFVGAQLEARVGVTDKIGVVGFYDTGYIAPGELNFDDGDWHAGAGLGLRYDTGIGPIRLDVGVPTTGSNAGEAVEVYLGIGQAF